MGGQACQFSFSQHASLKSNENLSKPSLRSAHNCSKKLVLNQSGGTGCLVSPCPQNLTKSVNDL